MRRAINLGEAEMTGGPGLLTVKGKVTLGLRAFLTPSRCVLCSGFFNRTLPDFPEGLSYKIISGSGHMKLPK